MIIRQIVLFLSFLCTALVLVSRYIRLTKEIGEIKFFCNIYIKYVLYIFEVDLLLKLYGPLTAKFNLLPFIVITDILDFFLFLFLITLIEI